MVNELQTSIILFLLGKGISANDLKAYSKSPAELNNRMLQKYHCNVWFIFAYFLYKDCISKELLIYYKHRTF